jgi:CheY-like chemotaxis protein
VFNIILADQNLDGDINGHQVISLIRNHKECSKTVMIGCTRDIGKHAASFYNAGADSVWMKPIPPMEMLGDQLRLASIFALYSYYSILISIDTQTTPD